MGLLDLFRGKGRGHDVEELARRIGIAADLLRAIEPVYREHKIPKRSGGMRTLHAPEPRLKEIQRLILRRVLGRLKSHPSAHGFERGRSIVTHAREHTAKAVVVHLDLKDFFTSTAAKRVEKYFLTVGWNREASRLLTKLTTHMGGLPQGAPTSPRLANLVNRRLDARLSTIAARAAKLTGWRNPMTGEYRPGRQPNLTAAYTRYADDISFSFSADGRAEINNLLHMACRAIADEGYTVHKRKKMSVRRSHQRQSVTGLVVNGPVPRLPREVRRRIRAAEHRLRTSGGATLTAEQLAGWKAYRRMIENQGSRG